MSQSGLYCVIATRQDGTKVVLARNLTNERANAIVDALSGVSAFAEIYVELQATQ